MSKNLIVFFFVPQIKYLLIRKVVNQIPHLVNAKKNRTPIQPLKSQNLVVSSKLMYDTLMRLLKCDAIARLGHSQRNFMVWFY